MKNAWKVSVVLALGVSGLVAFACGGGSKEGSGATTPSATQSATGTASPSTSTTASATPTATTPPPPQLPASYTAADDARSTTDAKLVAVLTKDGKCDALATELTKAAKDGEATYATWNSEWSKLTPDQKQLVTAKATPNDLRAIAASFPDPMAGAGVVGAWISAQSGAFKACIAKKDNKKSVAAIASVAGSLVKGLSPVATAGSASAKPK